jgi:hypothetical protein
MGVEEVGVVDHNVVVEEVMAVSHQTVVVGVGARAVPIDH